MKHRPFNVKGLDQSIRVMNESFDAHEDHYLRIQSTADISEGAVCPDQKIYVAKMPDLDILRENQRKGVSLEWILKWHFVDLQDYLSKEDFDCWHEEMLEAMFSDKQPKKRYFKLLRRGLDRCIADLNELAEAANS